MTGCATPVRSRSSRAWAPPRHPHPHTRHAGSRTSSTRRTSGSTLTRRRASCSPDARLRAWYAAPIRCVRTVVLADDLGTSRGLRSRVERRLVAAARDLAAEILAPLRTDQIGNLSGAARGLLYQLEQGLGTTSARAARAQLRALTREDRQRLERLGIRLGFHVVYLIPALKPAMVERRVALATAFWGADADAIQPSPSAVSMPAHPVRPAAVYAAIGFPRAGTRAVRADVLERIARELRRAARHGPFEPSERVRQRLSCAHDHVGPVIEALGYRPLGDGRFVRPRHRRRPPAA